MLLLSHQEKRGRNDMTKTLREKLINSKLEGALTDTKKKLVCEYIEKEFSQKAHFTQLEKFLIYERNILTNEG